MCKYISSLVIITYSEFLIAHVLVKYKPTSPLKMAGDNIETRDHCHASTESRLIQNQQIATEQNPDHSIRLNITLAKESAEEHKLFTPARVSHGQAARRWW
jgi:hypothetical protein